MNKLVSIVAGVSIGFVKAIAITFGMAICLAVFGISPETGAVISLIGGLGVFLNDIVKLGG